MAEYDYDYCEACEELRERDPGLIVNGFSDANCDHLQVDEGLTGEADDFEDLDMLNDCLVGILDDEAELTDACEWKDYIRKVIPNIWTVFKAIICAIGGLWTSVKSYELTEDGSDIVLTAWDGEHGRVSGGGDGNTTYSLSKSGNKIILTDSNGNTDEVTDSNTTYNLSGSGDTVTLTGSDGSTSSYTVPGGGGGGSYGAEFDANTGEMNLVADGEDPMVFGVVRSKVIENSTVSSGADISGHYDVPDLDFDSQKIVGVLGYNLTNYGSSTGVSKFNVYAIEPSISANTSVFFQAKNEASNSVSFDLTVTVLYVNIPS